MIFSFMLCIYMPRYKNSSGVYRPNTKKCVLLACLAQSTYPIPARCGTDTPGRGAFEPSPEDSSRTKLFDREFEFRESQSESETEKKLLTESLRKKMIIYIYRDLFGVVAGWFRIKPPQVGKNTRTSPAQTDACGFAQLSTRHPMITKHFNRRR